MKVFSLVLALTLCVFVSGYQLPIDFSALAENEGTVKVSDLMTLLSDATSEYGMLLSADANNVTLNHGDRHITYRDGSLRLSNSTTPHDLADPLPGIQSLGLCADARFRAGVAGIPGTAPRL